MRINREWSVLGVVGCKMISPHHFYPTNGDPRILNYEGPSKGDGLAGVIRLGAPAPDKK